MNRGWCIRAGIAAALVLPMAAALRAEAPEQSKAAPAAPDPARTILKVRRILATANVQCGGRLTLAPDEALLLGLARRGLKQVVDSKDFQIVERSLSAEVEAESKDSAFCARTIRMKPALIRRVRDAAHEMGINLMGL